MNSSRKGDIAEHRARTWLLEQGYEVFVNPCSTGPVDLVCMDVRGRLRKVDIKSYYGRHGDDGSKYLSKAQRLMGVRTLIVRGSLCYWAK